MLRLTAPEPAVEPGPFHPDAVLTLGVVVDRATWIWFAAGRCVGPSIDQA